MLDRWLQFTFSYPTLLGALAVAGKAAAIYIALLVGMRLLGRRQMGQMSVYDLILIVIVGNAVQNALLGNDTTLAGGLISALALLLLNRGLSTLAVRSPTVEHLVIGEPMLIVKEGHPLRRAMRKEGVTKEELMGAVREHGVRTLEEVKLGVLEVDGSITIVPKEGGGEGEEGGEGRRTKRRARGLRVE